MDLSVRVMKEVRYRGNRKQVLLYYGTGADSTGIGIGRPTAVMNQRESQNQLLNEECPGAI